MERLRSLQEMDVSKNKELDKRAEKVNNQEEAIPVVKE